MKSFWISWHHTEAMGEFEIHSPWWRSGYRGSDGAASICAALRASDEAGAHELIYASYDERPSEIEFRFCEERPDTESPFTDRFAKADWMPNWDQAVASGEATKVGPQPPAA